MRKIFDYTVFTAFCLMQVFGRLISIP